MSRYLEWSVAIITPVVGIALGIFALPPTTWLAFGVLVLGLALAYWGSRHIGRLRRSAEASSSAGKRGRPANP